MGSSPRRSAAVPSSRPSSTVSGLLADAAILGYWDEW